MHDGWCIHLYIYIYVSIYARAQASAYLWGNSSPFRPENTQTTRAKEPDNVTPDPAGPTSLARFTHRLHPSPPSSMSATRCSIPLASLADPSLPPWPCIAPARMQSLPWPPWLRSRYSLALLWHGATPLPLVVQPFVRNFGPKKGIVTVQPIAGRSFEERSRTTISTYRG